MSATGSRCRPAADQHGRIWRRTSAIALVNNGTIAITHDNAQTYVNSAMLLLGADSLVNNGTITMVDTTGSNTGNAAITAGRPAATWQARGQHGIATTGINAVGLTSSYTWGIGTVNGALINSGRSAAILPPC
jgi:hypothetical protein